MYSQFRVDDHDENKARQLLKKYADKHNGLYLVVKETGSQTGKPHIQGFCYHTSSDNSYRQFFSRSYAEHGTHSKCFTRVKTFNVYLAYIVANETKPKVEYKDLITNYTEEAYNQLIDGITPFVDPKKAKSYSSSSYDQVLDALDHECVEDGKIQYQNLMNVYMRYAPKKVNSRILYDNLMGYTIRLEYRYPTNRRARNTMYNQMCKLDEENGVFKTDSFSYLKFKDDNKNGGQTYTEYESDDCESDGHGS